MEYRDASADREAGWFSDKKTKGKPPRLRPIRWLREIFLMTQPSPPCGDARRGLSLYFQYIHTFYDHRYVRRGCRFRYRPLVVSKHDHGIHFGRSASRQECGDAARDEKQRRNRHKGWRIVDRDTKEKAVQELENHKGPSQPKHKSRTDQ